jgi:hypothetical protein
LYQLHLSLSRIFGLPGILKMPPKCRGDVSIGDSEPVGVAGIIVIFVLSARHLPIRRAVALTARMTWSMECITMNPAVQ